jgi:hypothetical protein
MCLQALATSPPHRTRQLLLLCPIPAMDPAKDQMRAHCEGGSEAGECSGEAGQRIWRQARGILQQCLQLTAVFSVHAPLQQILASAPLVSRPAGARPFR